MVWRTVVGLAVTVSAAAACGPKVPMSDGGGASSGSTSVTSGPVGEDGAPQTTSTSASPTTTSSTSSDSAPATTVHSSTVSSTAASTSTVTTSTVTVSTSVGVTTDATATIGTGPVDTGVVPQPDGAPCNDSTECESGHCYLVGVLGGICGECETDADCSSGGCSPPDPLANPPQGSMCNAGLLGDGCQTDNSCSGSLMCATVLDVPGVTTVMTCSECETDADCGSQLCSPYYDIPSLTGVNVCVNPGSIPNDAGCSLDGSGDAACQSGHCAAAQLMGLVTLGVCSECGSNGDCPSGMCSPPQISLGVGLIGGTCQ